MGVFNKLKEVLFDVEEEIPVIEKEEKKIVRESKVEDNPIKEVKMPKEDLFNDFDIEETEELPTIKRESNFNFPLDFEEELPKRSNKNDFFDEEFTLGSNHREPKKEESIKKKDEYTYDYSRLEVKDTKKDDTKGFKPSPIISPVYGILDQNYTKDDVIVKNDGKKRTPNLDEVRKKAYSKKENEEDSLKTIDDILKDEPNEEVNDEHINDHIIDDFINDDDIMSEDIPVSKEEIEDDVIEPIKEESPSSDEDEMETDLFNLIDSMYEDKNERDGE